MEKGDPNAKTKTNIAVFTYKGQDFDVLRHKKQLAYIFEYKGNRYGNAVKLTGKKTTDIMAATMLLLINMIDTLEAVQKNDSERT